MGERDVGARQVKPRAFTMIRHADETGVSGTGPVLHGVVFPSGTCVVEWRAPHRSVATWPDFATFAGTHIKPHPSNRTEIVWHDAADDTTKNARAPLAIGPSALVDDATTEDMPCRTSTSSTVVGKSFSPAALRDRECLPSSLTRPTRRAR